MPINQNPYFQPRDPYAGADAAIAQGIGSLGTALFGDPALAGTRQLREAQTRDANASAAWREQTNDITGNRIRATSSLGDTFKNTMQIANPDGTFRPRTMTELNQSAPTLIQALAHASGGDPVQFGHMFRALTAVTGNEDLSRAGAAASGANMDMNTAFTGARADAVAGRNAGYAKDQATSVAGIQAGSAANVANIQANSAAARDKATRDHTLQYPEPLSLPAATTALFRPGDPRNPNTQKPVDNPEIGPPALPAPISNLFTAPEKTTAATQGGAIAALAISAYNAMPEGPEKALRLRELTSANIVRAEVAAAASVSGRKIAADGQAIVQELKNDGALLVQDSVNKSNQTIADGKNQTSIATNAATNATSTTNTNTTVAGRTGDGAARNATTLQVAQGGDVARVKAAEVAAGARTALRTAPAVTSQAEKALGEEVDRHLDAKSINLDGPAKLAVIQRAAQLFGDNTAGNPGFRNMPNAIEAAMGELLQAGAPRTDWRWNPLSAPKYGLPPGQAQTTTGNLFVQPPGQAAPAAPAAPIAAPPAESRVVGNIYPTPKGPMMWTRGGWQPAPPVQ